GSAPGTPWSWSDGQMILAPLGILAALLTGAAEPDRDASLEAVIDRPEPLQFELGARLEFRAGQSEGTAPGSAIADLEIDPLAALRIPLRTGSLSLAYEPRVFIT